MSYCRFSCNNWKSDVYVYEDVSGGFTTHVARSRRTLPIIPDAPLSLAGGSVGRWVWLLWHRLHMWSLSVTPLRKIGGANDGENFNDETASECAKTLMLLRGVGYRVPQHAIDALRAEGDA